MPLNQLDAFLAAIRNNESEGNYQVVNESSGALGAYQIMPFNWDPWAAEAGLAGADWRDPKAQDRVARHKMAEYYRTYGSWDLAALAWRAGPGAAEAAMRNGLANASTDQVSNQELMDYVAKYRDFMASGGSEVAPYTGGGMMPGDQASAVPAFGADWTPETMIAATLDTMSRRVAGGDRLPLNAGGVPTISEATQTVIDESLNDPQVEAEFDAEGNYTGSGGVGPGSAGPYYTAGGGGHTKATNATRLADPDYQQVAGIITDKVIPEIQTLFPDARFGQYRNLNVRPPGGAEYSDHYWGGALDITADVATMDAIAQWAKDNADRLGINYVLWQQAHHYDHVHISWLPPGHENCILVNGYTGPDRQALQPTTTTVPSQAAAQGRGVGGGAATPAAVTANVTEPEPSNPPRRDYTGALDRSL